MLTVPIIKMMRTRKLFYRIMICLVSFSLIAYQGCGSSASTPASVADNFLKAFIRKDAAESFRYLSEKSKGAMGITSVTWAGVLLGLPVDSNATYEIIGEEISGDRASVDIKTSLQKRASVLLVKEHGRWMVVYSFGELYGLGIEKW